MKTSFPTRVDELPIEPVFVAFHNSSSYYSDNEHQNIVQMEVIGNIEQATAWLYQRETSGYNQSPFKLFKLTPAQINRTITIDIHEQA